MRKKLFRTLAVVVLSLVLMSTFVGCMANTSTQMTFVDNGEGMTLKKYEGVSTDVTFTVPDEKGGKPVTDLGDFALANSEYLKVINIGKNVKTVTQWTFSNSVALEAINVAPENPNFVSVDGVLYNKDKTVILVYPNKKAQEYTILEGVTTIANNAFYKCDNLTKLVLPSTLTTIGDRGIFKCYKLVTADIPSGVTSIGEDAMSYLSALDYLFVPSSVMEIKTHAFFGTNNMTDKVINLERAEAGFEQVVVGKQWLPYKAGAMFSTRIKLTYRATRRGA